jgi:transcriptional regulator of acetoin/glycerol metabolism
VHAHEQLGVEREQVAGAVVPAHGLDGCQCALAGFGIVELAGRGTLFLDEVAEMSPPLQIKLLRVLQEREVTPLGSSRVVPVDIALVCATNRRLQQAVEAGRFREDLFYRINGLRVSLPPLRERSDLVPLVMRMWAEEGAPMNITLSPGVLECFRRHTWPGNVRQLRSVVRTALAHLDGERTLQLAHLPEDFVETSGVSTPSPWPTISRPTSPAVSTIASAGSLAEVERALMRRVLEECRGNVSEASRRLGVSRNTLYRRLGLWSR